MSEETVKFSELRPGQFLGHDGEVISKEYAYQLIMEGRVGALCTVSDEFLKDVLDQLAADVDNGVERESYTSDKLGKRVIVDLVPGTIQFKGDTKNPGVYMDLTDGKVYKTSWSDPYDRGYYDDDRIITVIDDAGDEHHISEGDYTVLSLINEQEVGQSDE